MSIGRDSPSRSSAARLGSEPTRGPVKRSFVAKVLLESLAADGASPVVGIDGEAVTVAVTATGLASLLDGIADQLVLVAGLLHGGSIRSLMLTEAAPSRLVPPLSDHARWTHVHRPESADGAEDGLLALLPVSFVAVPKWAPRIVTFSVTVVGIEPLLQVDGRGTLQRLGRCDDCTTAASLRQAIEAAVQIRVDLRKVSFANVRPAQSSGTNSIVSTGDVSYEPLRHVAQLAPMCCLRLDMSGGDSTLHGLGKDWHARASNRVLDALQLRRHAAASPLLPLDNERLFVGESQVVSGTIEALRSGWGRPMSIAEAARSPGRGSASAAAVESRIDPGATQAPFRFVVAPTTQTPLSAAAAPLPTPEPGAHMREHRSESPHRMQNDLARDMRKELSTRFPIDARTMQPRAAAPSLEVAQPSEETLTERSQRRMLIQLAMQHLMRHPRRDYFPTAALVRLTSNIVAEFQRRYEPRGAPVRLPLGRYDEELLAAVCNDCMRAEVALDTGTPGFILAQKATGSRRGPVFDEVSLEQPGYIPDVPPMSTAKARPPPPGGSILVLTKPQLDMHRKRLLVYATIGVDIFDNAVAAAAAKNKDRSYKSSPTDLPYRWFLRTGPEQMLSSSREVSLEALFGLGVAESYILSYSVPITVALELDLDPSRDFHEVEHHVKTLVHRYRAGGNVPQPLQEGAQYTVGIEICRRDVSGEGQRVTAVQTFVIPVSSGVGALTREELRDILNPRLTS